jgi:uncharacterized protein (DUF736 family)
MAAGNKPDYNVRARDYRDKKRWHTIGVAWNTNTRDGIPYISVRLQSIPINFDGTIALIEPRENGDEFNENGNGEA